MGETRTQHLRAVCLRWKQASSFSFQAAFEGECRQLVQEPWRQWREYAARLAATQLSGQPPTNLVESFPLEPSSLVAHMLAALKELPTAKRFEKVEEFFNSEAARSISVVRITALFWASVARDVRAGRKPENFPAGSLYNDIDVVAAYAPFCDAMFVDKQVSHLAAQAELNHELTKNCHLYSFRQDEEQKFLAYLSEIEATALPAHLEKIKEVYGSDWPTPYLDLLADAG